MLNILRAHDELEARDGEVLYTVLGNTSINSRLELVNHSTGTAEFVSIEKIRRDVAEGHLRVRRRNAPLVSPIEQANANLDVAQQQALQVCHRITDYANRYRVSAHKAYLRLVEKNSDIGAINAPMSTVYRHLKRFRLGLLPLTGDSCKGNRTSRYSPEVIDAICELAKTYYLQPQARFRMCRFVDFVNYELHQRQLLKSDARLSTKVVVRTINERITHERDKARMQPELRAAAFSYATKRIRASGPLMRVEQDAVHLPFYVQTPYGVSKDVHLVNCIDTYTGIPMGWQLCIGKPKVEDTLLCLEKVMFSKGDILERYGISAKSDFFGAPAELVLDNGPENQGNRINALSQLGIAVTHCQAGHAHQKPYIERLNRSLKDAIETLPGCTRFDGKDGVRTPPEKPITLDELEEQVVRWYYQCWIHTPLKRHMEGIFINLPAGVITPAQVWEHAVSNDVPIPLPPSPAQWKLAYFERECRKISRKTGVTVRGFNFSGPQLQHLLAFFGEAEVTVLVNPDDFLRVYVMAGDEALIELLNTSADETTPAYTFKEAKELFAQQKKFSQEEHEEKSAFLADMHVSQKQGTPACRKPKSTRQKSKETTEKSKHGAALVRPLRVPAATNMATEEKANVNEDVVLDVSVRPAGLQVAPRRRGV